MKRWHGLTEQEIMVIINALQAEANENRLRFAEGDDFEKGNPNLLDDAQEQEKLAEKLVGSLKDILDPTVLDERLPSDFGTF